MATKETYVESPAEPRVWTPGLRVGAVAVAILAIVATFVFIDGTVVPEETAPAVESESLSREELMRDWVNRGLIPEQALESSRTREEKMRDWVNRGLIPAQALDSSRRSCEERTRDLVNRNLIPEQAIGSCP